MNENFNKLVCARCGASGFIIPDEKLCQKCSLACAGLRCGPYKGWGTCNLCGGIISPKDKKAYEGLCQMCHIQ